MREGEGGRERAAAACLVSEYKNLDIRSGDITKFIKLFIVGNVKFVKTQKMVLA